MECFRSLCPDQVVATSQTSRFGACYIHHEELKEFGRKMNDTVRDRFFPATRDNLEAIAPIQDELKAQLHTKMTNALEYLNSSVHSFLQQIREVQARVGTYLSAISHNTQQFSTELQKFTTHGIRLGEPTLFLHRVLEFDGTQLIFSGTTARDILNSDYFTGRVLDSAEDRHPITINERLTFMRRGWDKARRSRNQQEAFGIVRELLELSPNKELQLQLLAQGTQIAIQMNDLKTAQSLLDYYSQRAIDYGSAGHIFSSITQKVRNSSSEYDTSSLITEALRCLPSMRHVEVHQFAETIKYFARVLRRKYHLQGTVQCLDKLLEAHYIQADVYLELARVHESRKEWREALQRATQARELLQKDLGDLCDFCNTIIAQGTACRGLNQLDEALKFFLEAQKHLTNLRGQRAKDMHSFVREQVQELRALGV